MKKTITTVSLIQLIVFVFLLIAPGAGIAQNFTFRNGFGQPDNTGFPDIGRAVCTDASGNVYITGNFSDAGNTGNPAYAINFGTGNLISAGDDEGFVAKFNSAGVCQWSIRFGGTGVDVGYGIATDGTSVFVTGEFNSSMTVGASATVYNATASGNTDGFVMKLAASTGVTSWVSAFGGNNSDRGQAICLDASGNPYISGIFRTRTANPTALFPIGAATTTSRTVQGNTTSYTSDMVVGKLDPATGYFTWVSTGGSPGVNDNVLGSGICYSTALGEVITTGSFRNNGTTSTTAVYSTTTPASSVSLVNPNISANNTDFNILELSGSTGAFISGLAAGSTNNEAGLGAVYDPTTGSVIFCGSFSSASVTFPGMTANTNPSAGRDNILYGRYNPATDNFLWVKDADNGTPASAVDQAFAITNNGSGAVYITGGFGNTITFPSSTTALSLTATNAREDIFLAKIAVTSGDVMLVKQGAGSSTVTDDIGYGIAHTGGNIWLTGIYESSITFAPLTALASNANSPDVVLAKLTDIYITNVTVPANGTYKTGDQLNFTVNTNVNVDVNTGGGTPSIPVTVGVAVKNATYVSGTGTSALVFRYTVIANDQDVDGIAVGSSIALNGGTIKKASSTEDLNLQLNNVGITTAVLVDAVAPTVVSINRQTPSGALTNASSLIYRVTFSEAVAGVSTSAFALTATGTAAGTIASVSSATGTTIDVTVNTVTGDGTLRLDLKASGTGITDVPGNPISGGFTTGQTYTIDKTAPTVVSINRQTPSTATTNSSTLVYRVIFSENVNGVSASSFSLTATGTAAGTIASVSSATGTTIDVTVNTVTGDGTLRLDLKSTGTGITDDAGNATTVGFTTGQTYTIDKTAPTVVSINRQTPSSATTNSSTLVYRVNFSENVNGVSASSFSLTATGTAAGTIASVSSSTGTTIDVTVNTVTGNGTLRLDLKSSGTGITDDVGNAPTVGFIAGQTYTIDKTAPTVVSINRQTPSTATTNSATLVYRVTFSENVNGVSASSFSLTATGTATGTIASVSTATGTTIDVTVNSVTGDGTLRLDLKSTGTGITDDAGNAPTVGFTTGQTYTIDKTAPTVVSINRQTPSTATTNSATLVYRVTFSENVNGVSATSFSLTSTGTAAGTIASVSSATGTTIDVTVNTVTGDGTLRLDLKTTGTGITDDAGNAPTVGFTAGQTYTIDKTAPTVVSINRQTPSSATTNSSTLVYRVTFSENVNGVSASSFSLTATGTAAGTIASVSSSTGTTIDVTVNTVTGNGTLRLDLKSSGTGITDDVGNAPTVGFTAGQTYTIDKTAPTVVSINRQTPSSATTNSATLVYRVTFSENVNGVSATSFSLTSTGTAAGTIASVSTATGTTIDVTVNSVTGDGTLRLDLKSTGTGITDDGGNAPAAGFTTGQTYTIDKTAPTVVSINRQTPSTATTNSATLVYRVTFSENVNGVSATSFSLTSTGTAAGTIASVSSATGTTIDVTVNSVTGDGTLRLDLKSTGTGITDDGGNAPAAGFTTGQAYTIDKTAPNVVSINRQTPSTATTNSTTLVYRVTFSESVSGVDISDFSLVTTGSASATIASVSSATGTTIDVTVNSAAGEGTVRLDLNASGTGITDAVGNAITGGFTSGQTYTLDHVTQTPTMTSPQSNTTYGNMFNVNISLPETPSAGSVKLSFNNGASTVTLTLTDVTTFNFTLDINNPTASPQVVSSTASSIPSGTHTVTLSYQDATGNPAASSIKTNVIILNGALPIVLEEFNATKRQSKAVLDWKTSSEINGDRFEIERSPDGINFSLIAKVKAKGNSNLVTAYTFTDGLPETGNNFYRLKMVDKDGATLYSATRVLNFGKIESNLISIYPNPASDQLLIRYTIADVKLITIMDINGNRVSEMIPPAGQSTASFDISRLAGGVYFVVIEASEAKSSHKFIKKN